MSVLVAYLLGVVSGLIPGCVVTSILTRGIRRYVEESDEIRRRPLPPRTNPPERRR